jgi:hypothetical protein
LQSPSIHSRNKRVHQRHASTIINFTFIQRRDIGLH